MENSVKNTQLNENHEVKTATKFRDFGKRADLIKANPLDIVIDWDSNPRKFYGNEEFEELKKDIAKKGVINPIEVYIDKNTNTLNLAGGFRRMKAVLELINEGTNIEFVPLHQVENNLEDILASHYRMNNTGLPMNEVEVADLVEVLYNLIGDYKKVAEKMSIDYQKVLRYVDFAKKASTMTKEMVANKEMSLSTAIAVTKQTNGILEQNKVITEAKEKAAENGRKKVKASDLNKKIKTHSSNKNDDYNTLKGYINFIFMNGENEIKVNKLLTILADIDNGVTLNELIEKNTSTVTE